MAKVKQKSIIETLLSIPWWIHLFLIAGILLSPSFINEYIYNNPNQILYVINKKIMPEFTWIISGFLFLFMLIQFLSRYKKRKLFFNEYDIEQLKRISWQDFELLVTETFKRDGYKVKEAGGAQADGGIDLEAYRGGQKIIVQCKHWKKTSVGVNIVREMFGVGIHEQASVVYIVTCGYFTKDAKEFAKGKAIRLVNGYQLLHWIDNIKNNKK
jgi:restriction system protein